MFDYLQQFNNLPREIRDKVSSPQAMAILSDLENKYKVDLAMLVMKVMIKSILPNNLTIYFISELALNIEQAESLSKELKEKIFHPVAEYLGLSAEVRALDLDKDISLLIKEAGLVLASENLISRLKNILATYLRGVRSRIDARESLVKDVKIGGLGLSQTEAERLFKVCDKSKFNNLVIKNSLSYNPPIASRLDKIVYGSDKAAFPQGEYNLKQALERGETKPVQTNANPIKPDLKPDFVKPDIKPEPVREKIDLAKFERKAEPVKLFKVEENKKIVQAERRLNLPEAEKQLDLPAGEKKIEAPAKVITSLAPAALVASAVPSLPKASIINQAPVNPAHIISQPKKEQGLWGKLFKHDGKKEEKDKFVKNKETSQAELNSLVAKMNQEAIARAKINSINKPSTPIKPSAQVAPIKPISNPIPAPISTPISTPISAPLKASTVNRQAPTPSSSRPHVQDIKPMPKIMGPIEELQFLDLVNFRRLGKTPEEITTKIFAKIQLLERDGYDKMILGIKAWRQSPVNRLYLQMVSEALKKGLVIKELVLALEKEKKEVLSMAEIEAIISLNSKLVF